MRIKPSTADAAAAAATARASGGGSGGGSGGVSGSGGIGRRRRRRGKVARPARLTRRAALRMLAAMERSPDAHRDPVQDFLSSGRTGRRNAMPDILGEHASTSTAELPARLQQLTTTPSDNGASREGNGASGDPTAATAGAAAAAGAAATAAAGTAPGSGGGAADPSS